MANISIIGAGSFGCALAVSLFSPANNLTIWTFSEKEKDSILLNRENCERLPGVKIHKNISITTKNSDVKDSEFIFFAVPSKFLRSTAISFKPHISKNSIIINTSKGLEENTFKGGYEVLKEEFPENDVAIMCGPSHAEELARKIITFFVVASPNKNAAIKIKNAISNEYINIFLSEDTKGVEIGSSLKNLVAIGEGICIGLGCGKNTTAALLTKGLEEIAILGKQLGAQTKTFMGLAGLGDLIVTCESEHSRNRQMGKLLGQGIAVDDALAKVNMVVEGYDNAKTAYNLAKTMGVSLPLIDSIYKILFKNYPPKSVITAINTFTDY